ncbi:hypothetical protein PINS_up017428 [Pythium insidiosum]|nr:hypothetical protein PINS_up017428 [Pythium insidiosum]
MRSQLEDLEAEFDALLIQKTEQLQLDSCDTSMLKGYKDLTELRAKLAVENWELQSLNHRYITIEGRFRSVWAVEAEVRAVSSIRNKCFVDGNPLHLAISCRLELPFRASATH